MYNTCNTVRTGRPDVFKPSFTDGCGRSTCAFLQAHTYVRARARVRLSICIHTALCDVYTHYDTGTRLLRFYRPNELPCTGISALIYLSGPYGDLLLRFIFFFIFTDVCTWAPHKKKKKKKPVFRKFFLFIYFSILTFWRYHYRFDPSALRTVSTGSYPRTRLNKSRYRPRKSLRTFNVSYKRTFITKYRKKKINKAASKSRRLCLFKFYYVKCYQCCSGQSVLNVKSDQSNFFVVRY